jgi:hypothetical protein
MHLSAWPEPVAFRIYCILRIRVSPGGGSKRLFAGLSVNATLPANYTTRATPSVVPYQLAFAFIEPSELELTEPWQRLGISRATYFTRRRLRRAVAAAFELGKRKHVMPPAPARARPFHPSRAEAGELEALAARVARLTVSHKWPEKFFEDRSELVFELRAMAARANQRWTS